MIPGGLERRGFNMKYISILGSTGSIGTQTLEVVRENPEIQVRALAAGSNITLLEEQIREFKPAIAAVYSEEKAQELSLKVKDTNVQILSGMEGLIACSTEVHTGIVVTALVGMIGIFLQWKQLRQVKTLLLPIKKPWLQQDILSCPLQKSAVLKYFL